MLLRQILPNIDETDNKIIELLVQGKSNQEISRDQRSSIYSLEKD